SILTRAHPWDRAARRPCSIDRIRAQAVDSPPQPGQGEKLPMTSALERHDRFCVRTDLDADALWRRLLSHPKVRAAVDPAPDPPPPEGPPFLLARQSEREMRLRHWAGPADAASPVIVL